MRRCLVCAGFLMLLLASPVPVAAFKDFRQRELSMFSDGTSLDAELFWPDRGVVRAGIVLIPANGPGADEDSSNNSVTRLNDMAAALAREGYAVTVLDNYCIAAPYSTVPPEAVLAFEAMRLSFASPDNPLPIGVVVAGSTDSYSRSELFRDNSHPCDFIIVLPGELTNERIAEVADWLNDCKFPTRDYTTLDEVVVKSAARRRVAVATNSELLTGTELKRAACCNLGESFSTNPSVDVAYNDAATGARQIRLLGLSGTYVQMLGENLPAQRGPAVPYGLSYVPGPWMQSIMVSKGASSVKNGYESITGQINVEYLKPQAPEELRINGYFDSKAKAEVNATGNLHLPNHWSTSLLVHGEHSFMKHDGDDDGFIDMPSVSQLSLFNRWTRTGEKNIFQGGIRLMAEERRSGQSDHHSSITSDHSMPLYRIRLKTHRAEAFVKNGYIFDADNNGSVALMASASIHDQHSLYGLKTYDVVAREAYAQLMFERDFTDAHALSTGVSFSYDGYRQHLRMNHDPAIAPDRLPSENEAVTGVYAQYTFSRSDRLIAMAGLRYDYSSRYGSAVTPRLHLRWKPADAWSFNASVGTGRHSPHVLAEYSYLLASSRSLVIDADLQQESGVNAGLSATWTHSFGNRRFSFTGEYYYTRLSYCLTVDLDRNPHAVWISTSTRGSKGHTVQLEVTADVVEDLEVTAAWRLTDVKVDFGNGVFRDRPLTSANKWLVTAGWKPMMGLWQVDVSLAVNGPGRMPLSATLPDGQLLWNERYSAFAQLNAQVTRNFRHWAVYVGGENLTGYRQKNPVIGASNPWGPDFDATMVYGPLHGAMIYAGFRYNLGG